MNYPLKNDIEIVLEEEDIVKIYMNHEKNDKDGWLYGERENYGLLGYFPRDYVEILTKEQQESEIASTYETTDSVEDPESSHTPQKKWFSNIRNKSSSASRKRSPSQSTPIVKPVIAVTMVSVPVTSRMLWSDVMIQNMGETDYSKLNLTKIEVKRQEVIYEVFMTEKDYINDIKIVLEVILKERYKGD